MNSINPLSAIKPVGSATADGSGRQQSQQQTSTGQILTATVLESIDKNHAYLDLAGQKILARGDEVNLSKGTRLKLEILSTKPSLELRIISKNPEMFFGKTLTLLSDNLDIRSLFQAILPPSSTIFNNLSNSSQSGLESFFNLQQKPLDSADGGINLRQLLNRLGLSLEAILATGDKENKAAQTLKAALLEMTTKLETGSQLADRTNAILGTLELYQMAQLRLADENLLIFPLPLPFLEHGYLLVEKNSKESKDDTSTATHRFSLHLNLDPLGNIEIYFLQTEEGLYIRFACESKETKEFTSSFQDDLKKKLEKESLLGLSFTEGAGNPAQELVQQLIPDGKSMLDTKV